MSSEDLLYKNGWYAIHTKSRHEKLAVTIIKTKNLDVYLPVKKILKKWSDRKKIVEFPLFPGYFFVKMTLSDKDRVLHTKGVVRILGNNGPEPIPDEQIESLRLFENVDVDVDPYLHLKPGILVKVMKGPLKGCTGLLIKKKTKYRIVVNINVLAQAVSAEIDASDVSAI